MESFPCRVEFSKVLFLIMRWFFLTCTFFYLFACSNQTTSHLTPKEIISDSLVATMDQEEPFDLRVKKYEDPIRQSWQDPEFIMKQLGPLENKVVADIGAGTGYFSFKIAASASKVIAIDIDKQFLDYIEDRKQELANRNVANRIVTRLALPNNPGLIKGEADVILMVNTITYIQKPELYLNTLRNELKKDSKLVIVDYKTNPMPVGPPSEMKLNALELIQDLKQSGFTISKVDTVSLQYQYVIIAKS